MTFRLAALRLSRAPIHPRLRPSSVFASSTSTPLHRPFTSSPPHLQSSTPMAAQTDTLAEAEAEAQISPESLSSTLKSKLNITHAVIEDMSGGCGQAFNAVVVSPDFEGKSLLQRSRLVNGALKEEISQIHAWTPRCLTPAQWEREKEQGGR